MTAQELTYITPNESTTVMYGQRSLNLFGKLHYFKIVLKAYRDINAFYKKALQEKECYYGPFKGEFGHFLLHNLPFLSHLHQQGVRIHYCGMELHKAFLVDERGNSIIHQYYPLRDFFAEVPPTPRCLRAMYRQKSKNSGALHVVVVKPFWTSATTTCTGLFSGIGS
ncbi:MAG: hypothetical protein O9353_00310 [Bacteroidia bacterium]|nr:hypothetical protein [Bacteroidia bacterium]